MIQSGPRHRERGGFSTLLPVTWTNSSGGNYSSSIGVGKKETMDDVVTPRFFELQSEGKIIVNPMQRNAVTKVTSSTGPRFQNGASWLDYGQNWMGAVLPVSNVGHLLDGSTLRAECATRALSRVIQPEFQGLVSLAELRETYQYMRNPFKGAAKIADHFQKRKTVWNKDLTKAFQKDGNRGVRVWDDHGYYTRDWKDFSSRSGRVVKDVSDEYLSIRYGFRPLVYEVDQFMTALNMPRSTTRSKAQAFMAENKTTSNSSSLTSQGITYQYTDNITSSVSVHAGLLYQYEFDVLRDRWGISVDEILPATWELLPLSFIADWFVNVGEVLRTLSPTLRGNTLGHFTVTRFTTVLTRTYGSSTYNTAGWTTSRQPSGSYTYTLEDVYRVPTLEGPSLQWKNKSVQRVQDDYFKIGDLITIISQRLR